MKKKGPSMRHSGSLVGALLCLCVFVPSSIFAEDKKPVHYQQRVQFASTHSNTIPLKNGRELTYKANKKTTVIVDHWAKDQVLSLVYNSKFGMQIQDTKGESVSVLSITGTHPIDALQSHWEKQAPSTLGTLQAQARACKLWNLELNRVYKRLMKSLTTDQKKVLEVSQKRWIAYRDAEIESIQKLYGQRKGTVWSTLGSSSIINLTKLRIKRLNTYEDDQCEH